MGGQGDSDSVSTQVRAAGLAEELEEQAERTRGRVEALEQARRQGTLGLIEPLRVEPARGWRFNEPWFFIEGLLWAVIAWKVLGPTTARRWWMPAPLPAVGAATLVGLLSAFGMIGRVVIG